MNTNISKPGAADERGGFEIRNHGLGLVDEIIPEPPGGAHADHAAAALLRQSLERALDRLSRLSAPGLVSQRYERFRKMGDCFT